MPSPEIKVDRDVVLTINHQEFKVRKGESFIAGEGKLVIKPCRDQTNEGDEVNEKNSVVQDLDSVNHGEPDYDDAPRCCGGAPMLPYRIPREEIDRSVKIVSRWIDDIEREKARANSGA